MTSKRLLSSFILFQFFFSFLYYRGVSTVVWSFAFKLKSKSLSHSGKNTSHYLARGIGRIRGGEGRGRGQGGPTTTTTTTPMMMDQPPNHSTPVFAGFDLGTSGARISIIESSSTCGGGFREIYTNSITWKDCVNENSSKGNNSDGDGGGDGDGEGRYDNPNSWWIAIENLLEGCCNHRSNIASICVSGTSASCLIVDRTTLEVKRNPRMYDYDIITSSSSSSSSDNNNNNNNDNDNGHIGLRASELLQKYLPSKHTARANTSSFAKLIKWILESPLQTNEKLCHQSDYISSKLLFSTTATVATAVNENDNDNNEKKKEGVGMQIQIQSDWHNCLKLGYDVRNQCWPSSNTNNNWMELCLRESVRISNNYKNSNSNNNNNNNNSADIDIIDSSDDNTNMIHKILPSTVVSPGFPIGTINECVAEKLGLSKDVIVIAGTTDSNAAFFAAAASDLGSSVDDDVDDDDDADDITGSSEIRIPYGTAVTSLGSTTAIKFLSKTYVEDSSLGVYSHRFPSRKVFSTTTTSNKNNDHDENEEQEAWLVGGASNVGCAVFRALNFTDDELQSRSMDIDPTTDSESYLRYKYYPLLPNKIGERFPIADSTKQSVLKPIPDSGDRTEYLKGLFQSISEVERKGYDVLRDLGSNPSFPTRIMTSGGGSKNTVWISLRQRIMNSNNNNIINNMAGIDDTADKIEVQTAEHAEASYGAALLAAAGFRVQKSKT